jgi:IS5 family transposase
VKKQTLRKAYRLRNWKHYNAALVSRGSLTVWFADDLLNDWLNHQKSGKRGASNTYTDTAILTLASLQEIYHLPLRQTQGLVQSLLDLLKLKLPVPDYTVLCRRRRHLDIELPRQKKAAPLHLVVDATGVKIFGEGEWKVRQYSYSKRRTWRKLHLGCDEATGEIVAAIVTDNAVADAAVFDELLEQVGGDIEQVSGDGGYDKHSCYAAIKGRGARAAIPPRKGARIWQHGNRRGEKLARDENLRRIRQVGKKQWQAEVKYHRRSLAENQIFRLKLVFGEKVAARSFAGQAAQLLVRCRVMNQMTHLGMPDSYAV